MGRILSDLSDIADFSALKFITEEKKRDKLHRFPEQSVSIIARSLRVFFLIYKSGSEKHDEITQDKAEIFRSRNTVLVQPALLKGTLDPSVHIVSLLMKGI